MGKIKRILSLLSIIVLFVCCENKLDKLNFSKFEIKDQTGQALISVNDKGIVHAGGEETGKLERNGEIKGKEGKVVARINDAGELSNSKGEFLIKINANGDIDNGSGFIIKWDKNGNLLQGDRKLGMTISPNDNKLFRTASTIFFLYSYLEKE